jgi:hypothetical protein
MTNCAVPRDIALNVTSHAPAHGKSLIDLLDDRELLDLAMASRTVDVSRDMPHMRKMNMVRDLIDPHPRDRLLVIPEVSHLLDLGLLPLVRASDH